MDKDSVLKEALKYQPALKSYAFALLQDWSLAEDAVQDALIVITNKWQQYRKELGMFGWSRQIVHYKALGILRSRKNLSSVDESLIDLIDNNFQRHMDAEMQENLRLQKTVLHYCMQKLSDESRSILQEFYLNKTHCNDIANRFSRSVNSIHLMLSRIRRQLRKCTKHKLEEM